MGAATALNKPFAAKVIKPFFDSAIFIVKTALRRALMILKAEVDILCLTITCLPREASLATTNRRRQVIR